MTRFRIVHRTDYFYSRPVELGRHRLVLRPREGHDLHVESMQLAIEPTHRLIWSRDVFGNSVAIVDFLEKTTRLSVVNDVIVVRTLPFPQQGSQVPWPVAFPAMYDPLEMTVAAAYQAPSYPDDVEGVRAWLDLILPFYGRNDAEQVLLALGRTVHQQISYQRRSEKGVQTPLQTLQLASGSCRDMATLMMEAGRVLGVAMRFASGYLDCPASLAGRASTHAWTESYLPALGWQGFDPTLGEPTSLKHVVTGVSNHPRGVMPISGMFTGAASDYREMNVQVTTERLADTGSHKLGV